MGISINNDLLYLMIGALIGLVLGVNISSLAGRIFGGRFSKEQQLRRKIHELEQRLKTKDRLIGKAVKAAQEESKNA